MHRFCSSVIGVDALVNLRQFLNANLAGAPQWRYKQFMFSSTKLPSCAASLLRDLYTERVYRLRDLTEAQ